MYKRFLLVPCSGTIDTATYVNSPCSQIAVVSLTLENLRQGSSHNQVQQKQHSKSGPGVHQHSMELPANYGRIPISDEEIDIINVSAMYSTSTWFVFYTWCD